MVETYTLGEFNFFVDEIKVGSQTKGKRTIGATGPLVKIRNKVVRGTSGNPDPLAMGRHLQNASGWDRGHLIALEVGGPDISENIVPMNSFFNRRGRWKGLERAWRSRMGDFRKPYVGVQVIYDQKVDKWWPLSFKVVMSG